MASPLCDNQGTSPVIQYSAPALNQVIHSEKNTRPLKQGAEKAPLKQRKDDLYETPPEAVRALIQCERLRGAIPMHGINPAVIWEPCAGRGAISRELEAIGRQVVKQDLVAYEGADPGIQTGIDFLMELRAPENCGLIVTNPPFKNADAFVRHGLALGCDVIVLLRLMALEGANRSDLIDDHLVHVWLGKERLPMMHREGWEGPKISAAGVPFAWFVFSSTKKLPGFPIELRRMSWRG